MQPHEIINLIDHAHEETWHATIVAKAAEASSHDGGLLLNGLIARAEREPALKPLLYLLAGSCLPHMKQIPKSIEKNVNQLVAKVLSPRTVTQARELASAGSLAITAIEQLLREGKPFGSLCLRALAFIGNEAALQVLETYVKGMDGKEFDTRNYMMYELLMAKDHFDQQEYQQRILGPLMTTTEVFIVLGDISLDGLPPLPALHTVSLRSWRRKLASLLEPLASTGVKRLKLDLAPRGLKHLGDLELLPQLQELELYLCDSLTDVSALSRLPNFKRLSLQLVNPGSLKGFQEINQLWRLELHDCSIEDLKSIASLTNLQEVHLHYCKQLKDVSVLCHLPDLKRLSLSNVNLNDLNGLREITGLSYLRLSCCEMKDLNSIAHLTSLRELVLVSGPELSDISSLGKLVNLETLQLCGWDALKEINIPASLSNLRTLDLSSCHNLERVNGLQELSHLETLRIDYCDALKEIAIPASLTNLRTLVLCRTCHKDIQHGFPVKRQLSNS
ncbi:hypothetical protein KSF_001380 [Reticulibacter mediterranei]|uniref:Leucine-rich repeat domain-containing protein n=1 Tax=Reticulibacter mediterranei TaxID=2778369 RepID=A0A8J3IG40_9CHLR|nr:leucine-rich repeat domain-containing protein [Reticulibacter mediterranei]GHO90090.1 hypothetical protein KSF_001380 [Reticulibacter mediterranei]